MERVVVRHRRHRPQLSGGNRRLGDREPLDPGRHRIDAQAPSGTLCDLPLRLARTCAAWTWRSSTVRMSSNSKAAPISPCGSPRCPTGARGHRDDVGNDRRRALPLHGRALALAVGGQAASAFKRNAAADQMRAIADSVLKVNPATKIVAMGDFNDDPDRRERRSPSGRQAKIKEFAAGDFLHALRRHAQSRSGNARLPRRMEPLRQYRRFENSLPAPPAN